jgi:RNA polymerase sigma-70 factor (ECF subfamily)
LRYTCNEDDATQILNDGFLKVFNKIGLYEFTGSFEGWIKRIIFRTALDFIRQNKTYKSTITLSETQTDYDGEVYNTVLNSINGEIINKIIQKITPASRTVFSMFLIDGYSHKEIAETLHISENTSKWHLCNAKNQFIAIAKPHLAELFA